MKIDYHIHALSHGEYEYTSEWLEKYIIRARELGIDELGFSEHDEFVNEIDYDILENVRKENLDIPIKLGLEVDYQLGLEKNIKELTSLKDFDYIIGSVHYINGWAFDHPDYKHKFKENDIDIIYQSYFDIVDNAVKSDLFDVLGHIDLIKKWGDRPKKKDVINYIKPVLSNIKDANLVVELNSSGLRKEVQEIYPQYEIIELMKEMDIEITFGSDAHHPSQIALDLDKLIFLAKKVGYKNIVTFTKREKSWLPL